MKSKVSGKILSYIHLTATVSEHLLGFLLEEDKGVWRNWSVISFFRNRWTVPKGVCKFLFY